MDDSDKELFRERRSIAVAVSKKESTHIHLDSKGLKSILAPLYDVQVRFARSKAATFDSATRQWAFEAFDDFIEESESFNRAMVLTGKAGCGKTAITCKILETRAEKVLACHFCR